MNDVRLKRRYLSILGLDTTATKEELKKAYRKSIAEYHPDKVANLGEDIKRLADSKTKAINNAYDYLKKNHEPMAIDEIIAQLRDQITQLKATNFIAGFMLLLMGFFIGLFFGIFRLEVMRWI